MTSRRPPSLRNAEYALPRQSRQLQSMVPGSLKGRLASAQPVTQSASGQDALFGFEGGGAVAAIPVFYNDDIYTLASNGAQNLTLTFVPDPESLHVALNGVHARKAVDWTVASNILSLLSPLDPRTGDVVTTEYVYLGEQADPIADGDATYLSTATAADTISGPTVVTFSTAPTAGATVMVGIQLGRGLSSYATVTGITGLGATWANLVTTESGGSNNSRLEIWVGTGCNGTGTTLSVSKTDSAGTQVAAVAFTSGTVTGATTDRSTPGTSSDTTFGPLSGSGPCMCVYVNFDTFTDTPSGGWTDVLPPGTSYSTNARVGWCLPSGTSERIAASGHHFVMAQLPS